MRNAFTNGASDGAVSSGPLSSGLRVGRIAGVEVRLHWSWAIIAAILTIVLAGRVFPAEVAGLSGGAYVAMGLVTAVLFFATLLLHELGHALQARHEGIPTRGITLWMLGGVARSGAPFPSPGAEARVAIAGPVVSALLGAALVGAGHIGGLPSPIAVVLEWLGWTNVALLAFNMLPALPLDGGRVLRAVLWQLTASLRRGTHAATRVSQALSVALIVLGLAGFLVSAGFGGLWLAFIGWFVYSAATAERDAADAQVALAGVHVADVMTPQPITISPMATADDLLSFGAARATPPTRCSTSTATPSASSRSSRPSAFRSTAGNRSRSARSRPRARARSPWGPTPMSCRPFPNWSATRCIALPS